MVLSAVCSDNYFLMSSFRSGGQEDTILVRFSSGEFHQDEYKISDMIDNIQKSFGSDVYIE